MKSGSVIIASVILSVLAAIAISPFLSKSDPSAHRETSYERVIRTQTLRCGYEYWEGALMKDPATGQISGPWVQIMDAIGHVSGLKIEWAEQVGWGDVGAALKAGKIDAMCAGMWTSADKAKEINFTNPVSYQGIEAMVRADDHRFDGGLDTLNDPNVKIAVIDNDNGDFIAQEDFPKAQRVGLSNLNGTDSEEMMQVMTGKADVTFTVAGLWQQFNKTNSGKIRRLDPPHLLRVYGLSIAIDNDDQRLLNLLNTASQEIINSGQIDKILDQAIHDYPDMYIKPNKPF
jgi:polar amino acid transport system substrate-binding protein